MAMLSRTALEAMGFLSVGDNVQVSALASLHGVERIALGRTGQPEDVAPLVLFLAGDGARYISGQVIGVDGAMAM
jgi:NAD(P)-dependent dehydrogenase (short-subunit alcohol dehydrogenase family)